MKEVYSTMMDVSCRFHRRGGIEEVAIEGITCFRGDKGVKMAERKKPA